MNSETKRCMMLSSFVDAGVAMRAGRLWLRLSLFRHHLLSVTLMFLIWVQASSSSIDSSRPIPDCL